MQSYVPQTILIRTYVTVHCTYLKRFLVFARIGANNMDPDQATPTGAARSGSTLIYFRISRPKTHVVGTQKNRLNEAVISNTQNL